MTIPKFWIERPDDETAEFFIGEKLVGSANHDQHGWDGMKAAEELFESVAKTLGAKFESE